MARASALVVLVLLAAACSSRAAPSAADVERQLITAFFERRCDFLPSFFAPTGTWIVQYASSAGKPLMTSFTRAEIPSMCVAFTNNTNGAGMGPRLTLAQGPYAQGLSGVPMSSVESFYAGFAEYIDGSKDVCLSAGVVTDLAEVNDQGLLTNFKTLFNITADAAILKECGISEPSFVTAIRSMGTPMDATSSPLASHTIAAHPDAQQFPSTYAANAAVLADFFTTLQAKDCAHLADIFTPGFTYTLDSQTMNYSQFIASCNAIHGFPNRAHVGPIITPSPKQGFVSTLQLGGVADGLEHNICVVYYPAVYDVTFNTDGSTPLIDSIVAHVDLDALHKQSAARCGFVPPQAAPAPWASPLGVTL